MATTPNSLSSILEQRAEKSLTDLDSIEEVVDAKEQAEFFKARKDRMLAELELQEEAKGETVSAKQKRNALASKSYVNLLKRDNAKITISAWQTSVKEKGVYV
jgi:hypothetical protein